MSIGLGSTIEELVKAVNSSGSSITILSASVTYQASSSGTTVPSGTWSTSIPSVTNGQYLWTKTYVKYSDNTETTSYSVGYKGTNGSTPDISGKANLSGGNTFTGNQVFTGYLDIRGTAAEKHFKTRGIAGSDGNGTLSDLYLQYASDNKTFFGKNGTSSLNADGSISINGKKAATVDQIPTVPTKVSQLTNDSGFTKNTGTVTSVAVKMNGVIKGTITNSGTIDLGTILTAHQDISGKADKSSLATVATSGSYNDLQNKPTIPTNYVTTDTTQDITGAKTFKAPANISGSEQATVWFETSNGGRVGFGKEGPNSGTGIFFDQVKGTRRLNFRASATAGAIVWEQPEQGAQLYIDLGKNGVDHRRISMPSSGGTLALTSQIKTKISQLTNDSGYTTNKGTVTKVKVNGSEKSPDTNGVIDLGSLVTPSGNNTFTGQNTFNSKTQFDGETKFTAAPIFYCSRSDGTNGQTALGTNSTGNKLLALPDTTYKTLVTDIKLNGNTYTSDNNGLVDLGTISGGSGGGSSGKYLHSVSVSGQSGGGTRYGIGCIHFTIVTEDATEYDSNTVKTPLQNAGYTSTSNMLACTGMGNATLSGGNGTIIARSCYFVNGEFYVQGITSSEFGATALNKNATYRIAGGHAQTMVVDTVFPL